MSCQLSFPNGKREEEKKKTNVGGRKGVWDGKEGGVWISEGGYETRQQFLWNFVLNLASKKVIFFSSIGLGAFWHCQNVFLVGESHSRGGREIGGGRYRRFGVSAAYV